MTKAKRMRWGKFYWADFKTDPELKMCSCAAKGVWILMLCEMAENDGRLLLNGRAPTVAEMAVMLSVDPRELKMLIAELEGHGVFDRDGDVIVSRRMQRDAEEHARARAFGALGGNPNLRKPKVKKAKVNIETETETETETESPKPPRGLSVVRIVDLIWEMSPSASRRRSSKGDLLEAVKAALKRHPAETILAGMRGYFASKEATKDRGEFAKGAHRMVRQDRFLEFVDDDPGEAGSGWSEAQMRRWMEEYRRNEITWRPGERGPPPGKYGCVVPAELQREFGYEPFVGAVG